MIKSRLRRFLAFLVALVALTGAVVAVDRFALPGLQRSFYIYSGFHGWALRERVPTIDVAFLAEDPKLPRQLFSVRWRGFWFLSDPGSFEFSVNGTGRIVIRVDGREAFRSEPPDNMRSTSSTLALSKGPHEIVVEYEQLAGRPRLTVLQATPGGVPAMLPSASLFVEPLTFQQFRIVALARGIGRLVPLAWLGLLGALLLQALPALTGRVGRLLGRAVAVWRTESAPANWRAFTQRATLVLFPALVGPVVLFLVGPHTIYNANRSEFNVPFASIAFPRLLVMAAIGWGLLFGVGCLAALLSERLTRRYASLIFAGGVLLWIQGSLLAADVGQLAGEGLDLSRQDWRAPYEAGLWAAGIGLALYFGRRLSHVAPFASQVFVALQLLVLAISMLGPTAEAKGKGSGGDWLPSDSLYQLSRGQNVIHVVLDGFLSEVFEDVINEDRTTFDRSFSGFVFYRDHLGAFTTTRASMPAMLTGQVYRNELPFDEFLRRVMSERSIFTALAAHGYSVHSVSFHSLDKPLGMLAGAPQVIHYNIPTPFDSYDQYVRSAARQMFDLSLFRHTPQGLKSRVYNARASLAEGSRSEQQLRPEDARAVRPSSHVAFVDDLISHLAVSRDEPVYTFLHVAIPHPPIALGSNCEFLGYVPLNRASYTAQARCGVSTVERLLDRLRALGTYDRSVIVITADHGWRARRDGHPLAGVPSPAGSLDRVANNAMPLLAIKQVDGTGPLQISDAPTAITDLPATILDLAGLPEAGFPGTSVVRLNAAAVRPRIYAQHSWMNDDWNKRYLGVLQLFSIEGRVLDPKSWTFQRAVPEPGQDGNGSN